MDIATLHVTDALVNLTCGCMCLTIWHNQRSDRCFAYWGGGFLLFGLLAGLIPRLPSSALMQGLGYSLLDIATVAIWCGFRSFDGRRALTRAMPLVPLLPLSAGVLAAGLSRDWELADRAALVAHCVVAVLQATYVMRGATSLVRPRGLCALTIYVIAGSIAAPALLGDRMTPMAMDAFILLADHILTIIITLSAIAMVGERDFHAVLRASLIDPLTGALNRKGLTEALGGLNGDQAILMVDLDHFKRINDRFGHAGGDEVLRHFVVRTHEAIGDRAILARLGGEEFVIVAGSRSAADAGQLAETVRVGVTSEPVVLPQETTPFTISIGVALRHAQEDFFAAMKRADQALYQAKAEGRDRVVTHATAGTDANGGDRSGGRRVARRDKPANETGHSTPPPIRIAADR